MRARPHAGDVGGVVCDAVTGPDVPATLVRVALAVAALDRYATALRLAAACVNPAYDLTLGRVETPEPLPIGVARTLLHTAPPLPAVRTA